VSKNKTDKPRTLLRRVPGGFVLVYPHDEERLMHYAIGSVVEAQFWQQRSREHLALYWVILHDVVENSDQWPTTEHLHDALKVALGYTREINLIGGGKIYMPGSIAIDRMDQADFKVYFDRAMNQLREAGINIDAFLAEGKKKLAQRQQPYHGAKTHESRRVPDGTAQSAPAKAEA